ncbi:MAG: isopentenyl-diphosphate Delta-isomerase [Hyphomicrobium sp.]
MNDASESVILVDDEDREIGTAPKLLAHEHGDLHRAFSVLIHDRNGRQLLQKRHSGKYHSGGLWSNACCGHPRPGEEVSSAAARRLREEMGFTCPLSPLGTLIYRAEVGGNLIEHELVHIFTGLYEGAVHPDPQEADDTAWRSLSEIGQDVGTAPETYTTWFRKYLDHEWPFRGFPGTTHRQNA